MSGCSECEHFFQMWTRDCAEIERFQEHVSLLRKELASVVDTLEYALIDGGYDDEVISARRVLALTGPKP